MKSIRTTLLVSFLCLAALVLGGVSWYVYTVTAAALREREASMAGLLRSRNAARTQAARDRFDEDLLRKAAKVASRSRTVRGDATAEGMSAAMLVGASGHGTLSFVFTGVLPGQPMDTLLRRFGRVSVSDELLPTESDPTDVEFCLIHNQHLAPIILSPTLTSQDWPNLDEADCLALPLYDWRFDEFDLDNSHVRRVVYKAAVASRTVFFGQGLNRPNTGRTRGTTSSTPLTPPPPPRAERPSSFSFSAVPTVYVQYARETDRLDQEIALYSSDLAADLANLHERTREVLAGLRWRLGLVLFAATVIVAGGGAWLAKFGLRPLARLTDAVSNVSERDFRLKVEPRQMPDELVPIVTKLQQTLASLEEAFIHEKQAVADISHELRTPIASLVTTVQVCLKKTRAPEEYREALESCAEIGNHLQDLVEQILILARLDAGADPARHELLDLADLGQASVEMIQPLAQARGLHVGTKLKPGVLVESDANKLREVMTNLLSNAVQYNRPGGRIDLRIITEGQKAVIEVRDTGVGIAPEDMKHLFERFYRADPSRHADTVHAGLGLAIVKGYLDLLGGTIQVESTPGEGSRFRVYLPLAESLTEEATWVDPVPSLSA